MRSKKTSREFNRKDAEEIIMKKAYFSDKAPRPVGPYSQIVESGNLYFLAGQIPLSPEGTMREGDISAQTRQVMENLRGVLEAAGLTMNHIVKTSIFLADINDFDAVNNVYGEYFQEPFPARSTIQAGKLPKGARVEIDAIAAKN
jgi:2-iminobutanoate/2-iminopropanoate deaminase